MSAHGQFEAAALHELGKANDNEYTNARYAAIGNETVGKPFPAFREYAGRFTDWTPGTKVNNLQNGLFDFEKLKSLMIINSFEKCQKNLKFY